MRLNEDEHLFTFIVFCSFLFLLLMEAYQFILFAIIAIGFILIVLRNDKYKYLIKSIERFF